jgi:hypothetical protein
MSNFLYNSKEGRVFLSIELLNKKEIPSWLQNYKPYNIPVMCSYGKFTLYDKIPVVYAGTKKDVVGVVQNNGSSFTLVDMACKQRIYTLERGSFLKKEYLIKDERGEVFAKCFHKMKTIRKKKIRMILGNSEHLYSMEGGCFNNKTTNNEVLIYNITRKPVASVVFGEDEQSNALVMVDVLDPLVDKPLIVIFALYVMKTNSL